MLQPFTASTHIQTRLETMWTHTHTGFPFITSSLLYTLSLSRARTHTQNTSHTPRHKHTQSLSSSCHPIDNPIIAEKALLFVLIEFGGGEGRAHN